jgi:pilus assembly protein CpaF
MIFLIFISSLELLIYLSRRNYMVPKEAGEDKYNLAYLVQGVKINFENILNQNIADLNLNKQETIKREKIKSLIRKNLRNCSHGDVGAKEYIKDYMKDILIKSYDVKEDNINHYIHFSNINALTPQDKFEIILYIYKKQYGFNALTEFINAYHLAELKGEEGEEKEESFYQSTGLNDSDSNFEIKDSIFFDNENHEINNFGTDRYIITKEEIAEIYELESIHLSFTDKLEILTQRIFQIYKGFGAIDEIRDMKIDGVSGGISGIPFDFYTFQAEILINFDLEKLNAYNSIWIFFQGKTIHLEFLGFESQVELIRVCKNIYRYGNPGQLSESKGYIANDMKDGSRVVTFRPPFSDRWAFFVRKHDSILDMDIRNIIKDDGYENLIQVLKWMVRGCLVMVITGEMGSGKTTLLKLLIQYIRSSYTIRVHEQIFELNLSRVYHDRNILTLKETETVTGQDALNILKKTDGTVIILGEVASHEAASWLVETSQISKMTMCSHHAQTTEDLVDSLKIAQLRVGGFANEYLAEQQVAKAIQIDIHMENINGHRFISRITEIIPVTDRDYPKEIRPAVLEFFKRNTDRKAYRTVDIVRFENNSYVLKNPFSERATERIIKNLTLKEKEEFLKLSEAFPGEDVLYG